MVDGRILENSFYVSKRFFQFWGAVNSLAEDTEYQVEHKEGADNNERDEKDPVKDKTDSIIGLKLKKIKGYLRCLGWIWFRPTFT